MRSALAMLTIAALTLSGCGGGGRLTHDEFAKDASRICRHVRDDAGDADVPPFTSPNAAAKAMGRLMARERSSLAELRDLRPPKADVDAVTQWLAVIDQMVDEVELARDALERGEIVAAVEATTRAHSLDLRARELAQRYGVTPCRFTTISPR